MMFALIVDPSERPEFLGRYGAFVYVGEGF
jgi:hypothetical protein